MSGGERVPSFDLGAARMRPLVEADEPSWLDVVTDPGITSRTSWGITSIAEMSRRIRTMIAGHAGSDFYVYGPERRARVLEPRAQEHGRRAGRRPGKDCG